MASSQSDAAPEVVGGDDYLDHFDSYEAPAGRPVTRGPSYGRMHPSDHHHDHGASYSPEPMHNGGLYDRHRPAYVGSNASLSQKHFDSRQSRENLLGPRRPRPHKIWRKKFIKVLVVGDSGLGKTTLIKTLLSTPGEQLNVHDGSSTPAEVFQNTPESLCSTVTWKDEEDRIIWVYRVQDTPGFGDDLNILNNINNMLTYIENQNSKWLQLESSRDRKEDLSEVEDPRVDVCIYCIPPHRLRPIDLRFMHELGRVVPIIPVITKADTMTIREAQAYRAHVYARMQTPNLPGVRSRINVFNFDKETLERAGMGDMSSGTPPFLVIASNDINDELNKQDTPVFWPERRYVWGTAEAFNPDHSDLLHLRALLLKEGVEMISKTKRARYEQWRRRKLSQFKPKVLLRKLLTLTVPLLAAAYVGRHGIQEVKSKLGRVRRAVGGTVSAIQRTTSRPKAVAEVEAEEEEGELEEVVVPPPAPVAPPRAATPAQPANRKWF